MLTLETKLTLDAETIKSPNLTNRFTTVDLTRIGSLVYEGYKRDKTSRLEIRAMGGKDYHKKFNTIKQYTELSLTTFLQSCKL